jgi:hypothetical protein
MELYYLFNKISAHFLVSNCRSVTLLSLKNTFALIVNIPKFVIFKLNLLSLLVEFNIFGLNVG